VEQVLLNYLIKLKDNLSQMAAARLFGHLLSLLILFVLVRALSRDDYGVCSAAISYGAIFAVFCELGTGLLLVRDLSQNSEKLKYYVEGVLPLRAIAAAVLYCSFLIYFYFLFDYATFLFLALFLFRAICKTFSSFFYALQRKYLAVQQ